MHLNKKFIQKNKPSTFKEKWLYWLNSWRPSEIKKTWNKEYKRVSLNKMYFENKLLR